VRTRLRGGGDVVRWWQKALARLAGVDTETRIRLITDDGHWFHSWNGTAYKSDVVRAAIRPKVKAIGKLMAMHVRETAEGLRINPEPYMKLLLEEPNPYSSGTMFRERMATLLSINNNAFARIYRDENGYPMQLYPIPAVSAEAIRDEGGRLSMKFLLRTGRTITLDYWDVVHLRDDYCDNDVFGSPKAEILTSLLDIVSTSDQSVVHAVKRSAVLRWIMKFKAQLKPEDRDAEVKRFSERYLSTSNQDGIIASDYQRYDLEEVKQQPYVPTTKQQDTVVDRIYSFFGTNKQIVQASYNEDQYLAYYEAEIEPLARQMSEEFTRKLFTRRERSHGNRIVFGGMDLSFASMQTKLNLEKMVDRGALTPNEWRRVLNLGPIEGGDKPIRRLDTATVEGGEGDNED
jgi:HK97 family phage portal protein